MARVAALVPGRTRKQCLGRWKNVVKHNIGLANGRAGGKWKEDEDNKSKDAVQTHGVND
jgi:hypothetical protein